MDADRKFFEVAFLSVHKQRMGAGQRFVFGASFHVLRRTVMCFSLADTFKEKGQTIEALHMVAVTVTWTSFSHAQYICYSTSWL